VDDESRMAVVLCSVFIAVAAIARYAWQISLPGRVTAILKEAQEAQRQGHLAEAERACLRAVDWTRRMWLRQGDARVVTLYNLALVYVQQDKVNEAEEAALRAYIAAAKIRGASPRTAPLMALLAGIYKKLGKDLSACPVFQASIPLLRRKYGPQSKEVGLALHELAVTLTRLGLPEKAIEPLEECLPILENHLGKDHHDITAALANLGKAFSESAHYDAAENTYRRAIGIREAKSGPDDPEVALLLNNLAVTYKRQDRIPEALECLERSLAIREARLGPNHPQVGLVLNNIANCRRLRKQYAEAEVAVTRAVAILENPPHASLATALDSYASLRAAQGRYEEAEQLYKRCLQVHESGPSSSLIELAETCERYADVLYKLQREKHADALMDKVRALRETREKLLMPAA
jgi:tetratricopeptide (TPR) repeat protein